MKLVLANGCFDVLHAGHIEHLREARRMGDRLVVALTDDDYVRKGPGRPINCWQDRAEVLRELRCVSEVIHSVGAVNSIRMVRPNIFVKGIDYADGRRFTEGVEAACEMYHAKLCFTSAPKRSIKEIIRKAAA